MRFAIIFIGSALFAALAGLALIDAGAAAPPLAAVMGGLVFALTLLGGVTVKEVRRRRHLEALLPDAAMLADLRELVTAWRQADLPAATGAAANKARLQKNSASGPTPAADPPPAPPPDKARNNDGRDEAAIDGDIDDLLKTAARSPERAPELSRQAMTWVLRNALSENKVDLFLQPIVELPSRKPAHYECFARIRDDDQNVHEPTAFLSLAETKGMAGSLDTMMLFRAVQLIRGAGSRHRTKRFFCNLSPLSLTDADFLGQFEDYLSSNYNLAERVVFELTQAQIDTLDQRPRLMVERLVRLGFRLSVDDVEPASLTAQTWARYKDLGVLFIKTPAERLLSAADLRPFLIDCRRRLVSVIATHVEREGQIGELAGLELRLAQGYRFGSPRPARLPQQAKLAKL